MSKGATRGVAPHPWGTPPGVGKNKLADAVRCAICGDPMPYADAGETTHPTCDQEAS